MTSWWSLVIARAAASAVDLWADALAVYNNTDEEKESVFEAVVDTAIGIAEEYDACCGCEEDVIDIEYAVYDAITAAGF